MKRKLLKTIVVLPALALILFIIFVTNSLVGNPLKKARAKKDMNAYISNTYPDTDFKVEELGYNFKFKEYIGHIVSPSSEDSKFTLDWSNGEITHDSYKYDVIDKQNIIKRYETEACDQIRPLLSSIAGLNMDDTRVRIGDDTTDSSTFSALVPNKSFDKSLKLPISLRLASNSASPNLNEYASLLEQAQALLRSNGYDIRYYHVDNTNYEESPFQLLADYVTPEQIESGNLLSMLSEALDKETTNSTNENSLSVYSFKRG